MKLAATPVLLSDSIAFHDKKFFGRLFSGLSKCIVSCHTVATLDYIANITNLFDIIATVITYFFGYYSLQQIIYLHIFYYTHIFWHIICNTIYGQKRSHESTFWLRQQIFSHYHYDNILYL